MNDIEVLERFHRALIEEIQTQRPEYLTGPFTVAEIYQNLVPYGSHRDRIGVEMNADYEDALLRLLAGEGDFLVMDSEPALRDIRAELETSNPNTGLYREFAAVDVRLNGSRIDLSTAPIDQMVITAGIETEVWVPANELAPADSGPEVSGIVPPAVDIFDDKNGSGPVIEATDDDELGAVPQGGLQPEFVEPEPSGEGVVGGAPCVWCKATLPERDAINFCPYCGANLSFVPCQACGEELEPHWRFCVSCGSEAGA